MTPEQYQTIKNIASDLVASRNYDEKLTRFTPIVITRDGKNEIVPKFNLESTVSAVAVKLMESVHMMNFSCVQAEEKEKKDHKIKVDKHTEKAIESVKSEESDLTAEYLKLESEMKKTKKAIKKSPVTRKRRTKEQMEQANANVQ